MSIAHYGVSTAGIWNRPCGYCGRLKKEHVAGKCLFIPMEYLGMTDSVVHQIVRAAIDLQWGDSAGLKSRRCKRIFFLDNFDTPKWVVKIFFTMGENGTHQFGQVWHIDPPKGLRYEFVSNT